MKDNKKAPPGGASLWQSKERRMNHERKDMFRIKDAVINCYKILMDGTNGIFLPSDARRTALFGCKYMAYNMLSRLCDAGEGETILQMAGRINKECFDEAKKITGYQGEFTYWD